MKWGDLNYGKRCLSVVSDLVGEISSASNEQALGITEVTIGLSQIDRVTQQNTAAAEQSAAAAEELSGQATELGHMLARFTLKGQRAVRQHTQITAKPAITNESWGSVDTQGGKVVGPGELIALDDNEFGKY